MTNKISAFFKEVIIELKKVSWSTRNELIGSTIAVILLVIMLAFFIGVVDIVISKAVDIVIRRVL